MALGRAKNTDSKWINESKQPWENQTVLRRKLHRVDACSCDAVLCCGSKFISLLFNNKSHSLQNIAPPLIGMLCKMLFLNRAVNGDCAVFHKKNFRGRRTVAAH